MKDFFEKHDLPLELVDEHWTVFRDKLLDILIDTPIFNVNKDKAFGFSRSDSVGGIKYYLRENEKIRVLGRIFT